MPRGGDRSAKAKASGKKMGRPKAQRVVDGNVARKIKERVKAEELWVFLIGKAAQKAKDTGKTADLRQALEYLDDRDLGRCTVVLGTKKDQPVAINVNVRTIGD
jgi:hypothetical protein